MIRTLEKQLKSIIPNVALPHSGPTKQRRALLVIIYLSDSRTVVLKLQESAMAEKFKMGRGTIIRLEPRTKQHGVAYWQPITAAS